ncbi:MAG: NAD(P)H oxidoreductase [Paracoccus sp. (in: a-proteobacteria)]|uniref:NAD(P)H oxidoreductase n=1 Tax=Paracoccus sp. TaxID=267 RepID=UPI0026E0399C|nr:NAD(P)H oxidoreductase [Paracoccus sp. (in: a-proteobacteria)]MDO5630306.1 NAD(P)H oxidoreductase [Paracoccus sp. (in: a-proteobacteria)]
MKSVQLVWAHPRVDSMTAHVVDAVRDELSRLDVAVAELDLYRAGFDPVLLPSDEPDWENLDKTYSDETMRLADDLRTRDTIIFVFPIWWFSIPAMLKGYIDRVWNYGIAYGNRRRLPIKTHRWIGLAGEPESAFNKRGLGEAMMRHLNVGISGYCGAEDSEVVCLYDVLGGATDDIVAHHAALIEQARNVVRQLAVK